MKSFFVTLFTFSIFLLQGCQTLKEGAETSYLIRENGFKQERVEDATRRQIISVSTELSGLSITAEELEYSTLWSYPITERVQISDRTLSRLIAAGGVFFTAGLAYFDKDFERMWGDERIEAKVVNSSVDRSNGKRIPASTTVGSKSLEGAFPLKVLQMQTGALGQREIFRGTVIFRSGKAILDFLKLDPRALPGQEIRLLVTLDQPLDLKPLPQFFTFDTSLGSRVFTFEVPRKPLSSQDDGGKVKRKGALSKPDRCKRMGIKEETEDFSLCLRSLN